MLTTTYLVILALAGGLAFWDAPLRLAHSLGRGEVMDSRRYHLVNLLSVMLLAAWLALILLGVDAPLLATVALPAWLQALGIAGAVTGFSLALWARAVMGRAFVPTAAAAPEQAVIETGPFAHVRHPFYTGMWLGVLAGCLAMDSLLTLVIALVLVPVIREIAILEESYLARVLGGRYTSYARELPRFLPGQRPAPVGRPGR